MRQIGPYKLTRVLGVGGMGQVFQVIDSRNEQKVALKVIKRNQAANEAARMRFVQEARAVLQLRHPHIVAVHDFGQARGTLYIAMEYLRGRPLSDFIPGPPALSLRRKLLIMAQCAEALGYAHAQGVVHRDVKPANMIILADRSVKLVDFGLAALIHAPHSATRGGTPPYMSPEQIGPEEVDGRTDIWSAGVTLFELLTGRLPFRSMDDILSGRLPTLPREFSFAADLNQVLALALARNRETRYASAKQLAADLRMLSQRVEQAAAAVRRGIPFEDGGPEWKPDTPSSVETETLPPDEVRDGKAVVSPPLTESSPAAGALAAQISPSGEHVFSELGFRRPGKGDLEARVGRFAWDDRLKALRAQRDKVLGLAWMFRAFFPASAVWIGVLLLAPRISPDARDELMALGAMGMFIAVPLLLSLVWLALTLVMRMVPALGAPEHAPECRGCGLRMRRTGARTRVCSSREEVFFGQRDCMAALKHRLWEEAASLLSIYGEEDPSRYRERFTSVKYHASFFECLLCGHHAARLTSDELIEKRWEENPRFEEVYWGSAAESAPSRPASAALRSSVEMGAGILRDSLCIRIDRPVLAAACGAALALVLWLVVAGSRTPAPLVSQRIASVALSGSGRWLAAGTDQGRITLWDMASGASRQIALTPGALNDLRFSPAEDVLAIGAEDLALYDPAASAAARLLRSDHKNYRSVGFSRDGQTLVATTRLGAIETIDAHSGAVRLRMCCSSILGEAGESSFTPDDEAIASGGMWPGVWDARTGKFLGRLPTDKVARTFRRLAFDPHRDIVAMGADSGAVWVWNWKSRRLLGGTAALGSGRFSSVDSLAVSSAHSILFNGGFVTVWNPETGALWSWDRARATSNLLLSADGASLILGTANGVVEFWSVARGQLARSMKIAER